MFVPGAELLGRIVEQWLELLAPPHEYLGLIHAVGRAHAAVPLAIAGRRWGVPTEVPVGLVDLRKAAPLLAVQMPRECVGALLQMGGAVQEAVLGSIGLLPEVQHVLSVRRPDLFWFIASCHTRLRGLDPLRIRPALRSAIAEPWELEVGTQCLRDLTWAAHAVQARFARPGTDVKVGGTPAAAVSLRDKTLLLYVLLWGRPAYADRGCPACAPGVVRAVAEACSS